MFFIAPKLIGGDYLSVKSRGLSNIKKALLNTFEKRPSWDLMDRKSLYLGYLRKDLLKKLKNGLMPERILTTLLQNLLVNFLKIRVIELTMKRNTKKKSIKTEKE